MAHCDEYSELISASLDGALSPAETEKLNAHLAQCPDCRALLEELSALHAALSDLPPVEVPSGLTERIMAAVAAEQVLPFAPPEQKKPSIRWQRWLASAAVLAVVLLGTWSWKPWERRTAGNVAPAAEAAQAPQVADVITETKPEAVPQEQEEIALQARNDDLDGAEPGQQAPAEEPTVRSLPADGQVSAKSAAGTADAAPAPQPDPTPIPEETAVAPRMAVRMDTPPLLSAAPEEGSEPTPTPEPALFSASIPPQAVQAPAENGIDRAQPFMAMSAEPEETSDETPLPFLAVSNGPEETPAENPEVTPREALERLVGYIFEYSGYDSVEYLSEEDGLYAQVTAPGHGGTIYFLPYEQDETLYWFEFHPEIGDDVSYYTVDRLTGEPTALLGE